MSNISSEQRATPPRDAISLLRAALESLRPYQWLKNVLVFVPLAAAHRLGDPQLLARGAQAFIAFSLCASSVYLLNDLHDASADRMHPHKNQRPIASGRLPPTLALALVPILLAATLVASWPLGLKADAALASYLALMIAYTLRIKAIVLLDALVLAAGYALRVLAGGLAVAIPVSYTHLTLPTN